MNFIGGLDYMHILLAYRHRLLRDSIRPLLLRLAPHASLVEIATLDEVNALSGVAGLVDLAVLGHDLPGISDHDGIAFFSGRFPNAHIVLLVEDTDPLLVLQAIARGASGVIFKSISARGLQSALRLILAGEIYLPSEVLHSVAGLASRQAPAHPALAHLSPAEAEVVPLLLGGLGNKMIGQRLGIEEAAVKARLRCIYRKVGAVNRAQAVIALVRENRADTMNYLPIASLHF